MPDPAPPQPGRDVDNDRTVPQATHWACLRCGAHRPVAHVNTGPPPLGGDAAARWAIAIHAKTCTRRTR